MAKITASWIIAPEARKRSSKITFDSVEVGASRYDSHTDFRQYRSDTGENIQRCAFQLTITKDDRCLELHLTEFEIANIIREYKRAPDSSNS